MNWRGTPLVNLATIVNLIGSTHSRSGLRVRSEIDRGRYPGGITVTDAQMATVWLTRHRFHGEWNYTIPSCVHAPTLNLNHHYDERISPERYLDLEDVIVCGVEMVLPIAKLKDPDRVDEPEIGAKGIWIFDNNWARPRDLAQADRGQGGAGRGDLRSPRAREARRDALLLRGADAMRDRRGAGVTESRVSQLHTKAIPWARSREPAETERRPAGAGLLAIAAWAALLAGQWLPTGWK